MAAPHDEDEPIARQRLAERPRRQGRLGGAEAEIDLAELHVGDDVAADRLEPQIDARRFGLKPGDQPRRQQDALGVGGGEADRPFERRRIEVLGAKKAAELSERGRRLRREVLGERRRNEPAVQADEQRIGKDVAQPRQRPAHRRLA